MSNVNQNDPYKLHGVVMPLVRLIAEANLSWADKQKCADAIAAANRHYREMMAEADKLAGAGGSALAVGKEV
jgi:hypothetical protein